MISKKFLVFIVFVSLIVGFSIGLEYRGNNLSPALKLEELTNKETGQPKEVDFGLFWDVWKLLREKYVDKDKLDTQKMVFGAIEGMVNSIGDPFTVFLSEKENKRLREDISGEFYGVGIEIGTRKGVLTVISPLEGTPAEKAGLLAGDKIIKIDGDSTVDITLDEAVSKIRGKRGTKVILTILRKKNGEEEIKDFEITRDRIKIPTVKWKKIEPDIGYVQLFSFNQIANLQFDKAIRSLREQGAGEKLILDLRNNPGGLLDLAVDISSYFLDPGDIVVTEAFGDGRREELKAKNNGLLKNAKVVVLINKGSASASEIVAGALHDNKGITLVGEKTFGKGSVQQVEELRYGTSLKITIAKWLTPSGRSINDEGIEPDVKVKRTEEDIENDKDPQLDKAIEIIKGL